MWLPKIETVKTEKYKKTSDGIMKIKSQESQKGIAIQ